MAASQPVLAMQCDQSRPKALARNPTIGEAAVRKSVNGKRMTTIFSELLSGIRLYLEGFAEPGWSFVADLSWDMPARQLDARPLAVVRHLPACTASSKRGEKLVTSLADKADRLHWGQTYAASDFGQDFLDGYGWVELFGTRGHFANDVVAGGFLLLGPGISYPDHHHVAEEIYIPLTGGAQWRKGEGGFVRRAADEVIHHPSNVNHAMRTGPEPLLALYLWRGGPLAQKSVIGR